MSTRKTIVFKINNEVVSEEPKDLTIEEIYQYKECIANEFGCDPYEIEVNLKDECIEDSELVIDIFEKLSIWVSLIESSNLITPSSEVPA